MPQEHRLILKHADAPGYSNDLECYLRHGGYETLKKALALSPTDLPDGRKPQERGLSSASRPFSLRPPCWREAVRAPMSSTT